jgi:hypothetical protein
MEAIVAIERAADLGGLVGIAFCGQPRTTSCRQTMSAAATASATRAMS